MTTAPAHRIEFGPKGSEVRAWASYAAPAAARAAFEAKASTLAPQHGVALWIDGRAADMATNPFPA